MTKDLQLISPDYLKIYSQTETLEWSKVVRKLKSRTRFSVHDFEYYIIASSLFSSKIEGNTLDLNSFMHSRLNKSLAKSKEVKEIEELVNAYKFASENQLTEKNFLKTHSLLSKTLLKKITERGKYRKTQVGVFDNKTGRPVYLAVEPENLKKEITLLFADLKLLSDTSLTNKEIFYYASMIHLWAAMIHPFTDGNGRAARLLEKWFLASKLGRAAWSVNTEKYYWDNRPAYYKNISLGYNYYALRWERCIPFLLMLPGAVKESMNFDRTK